MKRSTQRILTTHVGSLPRPPDLLADDPGEGARRAVRQPRPMRAASRARSPRSFDKQAESGIDIVADGEMGRFGFIPYVNERLAGIEPRKSAGRGSNWAAVAGILGVSGVLPMGLANAGSGRQGAADPMGLHRPDRLPRAGDALQRDIDNLKAALAEVSCEEAFMPAVSPTNLANWNINEYYKTDEEFRIAIADALHEEYQAIVDAGLVLQIDDPQLASHWAMHPEIDLAQCRKWASASVELLNHALRGIPAERVRYHTCYSINMGPRVHDMELKHIVDIMLQRAGRRLFVRSRQPAPRARMARLGDCQTAGRQGADPRRRHPCLQSRRASRDRRPADRRALPASVGRENVIAGADCGFASFSTSCEVHPSVVWAKFAALAEGARLATSELWSRA